MTSRPAAPNEWVRTSDFPGFSSALAGISGTRLEWLSQVTSIKALGLVKLQGSTPSVPVIGNVFLDLWTDREIRIIDIPVNTNTGNPKILAEAVFEDTHPTDWVDKLAMRKQLVLAISPRNATSYATIKDWMADSSFGIIQVSQRIDASGNKVIPGHNGVPHSSMWP